MSVKSVCVFASQIATAIGCNRHKKSTEIFETMWRRSNPESYFAALQRNGIVTDEARVSTLRGQDREVATLLRESDVLVQSSDRVMTTFDVLMRRLRGLKLGFRDRQLVETQIKKNLFTNYGNAFEARALQALKTKGVDFVLDDTYYRRSIGTINGVDIQVGGRVDALTTDRQTVLEIKNRVRRLFYRAPYHEFVQVCVFLGFKLLFHLC